MRRGRPRRSPESQREGAGPARAGASLHHKVKRRLTPKRVGATARARAPHAAGRETRLDARHEDRANAHPLEHPLREGPEIAVVVQYPAAQDGDEPAVVATDEARSVPDVPLHGELNVVVEPVSALPA